ncbi:MAG: pyruvate kinase alpha/beta domain-containing protein [Caldimicrobium sp.]
MTVYFPKPGPENTEACIEVALKALKEKDIQHLVVASTYGDTGLKFARALKDEKVNLVVVTHNYGFREPGLIEMKEEIRKELQELGAKVYTGTMVFRGVGSAIRASFHYSEETLIAQTLRIFGQGLKVCVEITLMACDAGLIPPEDVIAVAGTVRGADTVAIIKAMPSNMFFNLKVREILAKPRDW